MKIVSINSVVNGSTGGVMLGVANAVRAAGGQAYTFSEKRMGQAAPAGHRFFGSRAENLLHRTTAAFTGISGTGSKLGTAALLRQIQKIQPDIIHLHNLHGWYVNLPMLFSFLKKSNTPVVWTLHDCWAFTAQCSHFTMEQCEKWKTGCHHCPRYRLYPYTFVDKTAKMWPRKKAWLQNVPNLTLVTPSGWLKNLVSQSFLSGYPVRVIHNGISLNTFCPIGSNFRQKYGLQNKKIVLGVASAWSNRKGLDAFLSLAQQLDDSFKIVLVGAGNQNPTALPGNILWIKRTENATQLAEIYSAADVFFNPTREENYPTVNMEALACGTPVVTFNTGGCAEIVGNGVGSVVSTGNLSAAKQSILNLCGPGKISPQTCTEYAQRFSGSQTLQEYCNLFQELLQS